MAQYLDYNASTPLDSTVLDYMMSVYKDSSGNADSRTHSHGTAASEVVESARAKLAELLKVDASEIIFTSGATESSNTSILGLANWGKQNGKTHIITTAIEHKATLEPIRQLEMMGFTADYIPPEKSGVIDAKNFCRTLQIKLCWCRFSMLTMKQEPCSRLRELAITAIQTTYFFMWMPHNHAVNSLMSCVTFNMICFLQQHIKFMAPKALESLPCVERIIRSLPFHRIHSAAGKKMGSGPARFLLRSLLALEKRQNSPSLTTPNGKIILAT